MDEFYLPEEIIEWLSLKKGEYLAKLIENFTQDDIPFEEHGQFEELIPSTLSVPDWSVDSVDDGQRIRTFCRSFANPEVLHQVVIGALVPDQNKNDVLVPIISFVTRKPTLVELFCGGKVSRPTLN